MSSYHPGSVSRTHVLSRLHFVSKYIPNRERVVTQITHSKWKKTFVSPISSIFTKESLRRVFLVWKAYRNYKRYDSVFLTFDSLYVLEYMNYTPEAIVARPRDPARLPRAYNWYILRYLETTRCNSNRIYQKKNNWNLTIFWCFRITNVGQMCRNLCSQVVLYRNHIRQNPSLLEKLADLFNVRLPVLPNKKFDFSQIWIIRLTIIRAGILRPSIMRPVLAGERANFCYSEMDSFWNNSTTSRMNGKFEKLNVDFLSEQRSV